MLVVPVVVLLLTSDIQHLKAKLSFFGCAGHVAIESSTRLSA